MNVMRLAARMLRREWQLAELRTLALALLLAIVALGVVATLAARVERGILTGAADMIGADAGISAPAALPNTIEQSAHSEGLALSATASFPSVAFAGEHSQLVDVDAVDAAWPLRGQQILADADGMRRTGHGPAPGTLYLDHRAMAALGVDVGGHVQLGGQDLLLAAELVQQPDGGELVALAPRAQMNLDDARAAGLLGEGSRARHQLLVAGDAGTVQAWLATAVEQAPRGAQTITPERTQERLRSAFERAGSFLRLTALLAALLAGVAIALAAQRYARRKTDEVALLRAMGTPRRRVLGLVGWTLAWLALPTAAIAIVMSLLLAQGAWLALGDAFNGARASLPLMPALGSALAGIAVLAGFALPPLARLGNVAPAAVFRRESGPRLRRFDVLYVAPLLIVLVLMWLQGGSWQLAAILGASLAGVALVAWLLAAALLWLTRRIAPDVHPALRLGLAALARRRQLSLVQAVALSLGLSALLLLGVVAPALLEGWRQELPPDTPNWFALNVQDDQRADFVAMLDKAGATQLNMLPLAIGRLVAINDQPIDQLHFDNDRAERRSDRQLRLSWSTALPEGNRVVAGRWFDAEPAQAEVSVDESWRDMFALSIGDRMRFDVGGSTLEARVTSVREVDWRSFRVNFFLVFDAVHAADLPHSWLASFHLPRSNSNHMAALSRTWPNVSLIDVDDVLDRLRDIVGQVSSAVRWVLVFSLLAGALVLAAALAASAAERRHEAALLRTLGAHRTQLRLAAACEFALLGLIAAGVSVIGAAVAGTWLARSVFHIEHFVPPLVPLSGIALLAALAVMLLGLAGTRRVASTPPLALLRRG